jgi:PAS domain S-box-containing protein
MLNEAEVLRSALEATPVGLYIVDRQRKIVLWSEGAERLTGYLRQEVIGHSCRENLLDHCDASGTRVCETACPLTSAIQNGYASDRVLYLKHKDGHRVPVRVFATGVRSAHGSVIGAMETFHEQTVVTARVSGNDNAVQLSSRPIAMAPNRPLTLALLREALGASRAQMTGCGVACIEIAQYEQFKATHTKTAANQMMESMGSSIRQMLRQTDQVGRWSESQLLVILPGCHASSLETVMGRLAAVAHQSHIKWWGDELSASVLVRGIMAREDENAEAAAARAVATAAGQPSPGVQGEDAVSIEK